MTNVTNKMATRENKYMENDETFTQRCIPEMTSTLRSQLIFGDDTAKNIKKAGSSHFCTPRTYEMQEQGY